MENAGMQENEMLFKRQFLLTNAPSAAFPGWQYIRIGKFHLYAHPAVELTSAASEQITVAMVGFAIDPYRTDQRNENLLNRIASEPFRIDTATDYIAYLAGRFVIIIQAGSDLYVFHDPCGLRSVYYAKINGHILIGSQSGIFTRVTPLPGSTRSAAYNNSWYRNNVEEHWIPSGCSVHEEVCHLAPNHYLSIPAFTQIRYWPDKPLRPRELDDVVAEASSLLRNLVTAGSERFKLALPLTAGWDSRTLLSASKDISHSIYLYTLKYQTLTDKSADIAIPGQMLDHLNLKHNLIACPPSMPEWMADIYRANSPLAHVRDWGGKMYGLVGVYPSDHICVKGSCSEIARSFYYKAGSHPPVESPEEIVRLESGWDKLAFIRDQVSTWFYPANAICKEFNFDILDLFYWEHRMGSWQALSQLEWDLVHEEYTPFNHRGLLELLLSVSPEYRCAPDYRLYQKIIGVLWPEIMAWPVNPRTPMERLSAAVKKGGESVARKAGIYDATKAMVKRLKSLSRQ